MTTDGQTETRNFTLPLDKLKQDESRFSKGFTTKEKEELIKLSTVNMEFRTKTNSVLAEQKAVKAKIKAKESEIQEIEQEIASEKEFTSRLENALFHNFNSPEDFSIQAILASLPSRKRDQLLKSLDSSLLSALIELEQQNTILKAEDKKASISLKKARNDLDKDKQKIKTRQKKVEETDLLTFQTENKIKNRTSMHVYP